jgi:hypothetical protein
VADLIVVFGPPASGKAAVGKALAERTGFRFFHNHMTAEPVAALFGWHTDLYREVVAEVRRLLLSKALARPDEASVVFTFLWALELEEDNRFIADLVALTEGCGGKVFFVELLASRQARVAREGTPLRMSLKPAKRDVASARALHAEADAEHVMNTSGDFPYPQRHLVIDTEKHGPEQAADLIARHFGFPATQG